MSDISLPCIGAIAQSDINNIKDSAKNGYNEDFRESRR